MVVSTGYAGDRELLKTDYNGNASWRKTYTLESAVETHLRLALETSDGGFLIGAWVYPSWDGAAWFVKTDGDGNPLWNLTTSIVNGYNSNVYSIIEAGSGEYVYFCAVVDVNSSNDTRVWLAKTSTPDGVPTKTPTAMLYSSAPT